MIKVETHQADQIRTLFIKGVLDYSTISEFKDAIDDLSDISKVVIDFTSLDFIDSTGIGAILDLIYNASDKQISVEFKGLNDDVKDIFDMIGVFRVIESLRRRI